MLNRYKLVMLCYLSRIILCLTKASKICKIYCFFLETESHFSSLIYFFFSQNSIKKKLYADLPEMFNSDPKTSIQKYPIFCSWYNVFISNVSDFTRILLVKIKNFELSYLHKKLSYTNTFR